MAAGRQLVAPQTPARELTAAPTPPPARVVASDSGEGVTLFNPAAVATVRYRYRSTRIPLPWTSRTEV
jgi:hypothetical protein